MLINEKLKNEAVGLLKSLIAIPSFSGEEAATAQLITDFFTQRGIPVSRKGNNVWARPKHWKDGRPTILLNSHHDTVKPVKGWLRDPFLPIVEDGKLYGLGSNDAGASLVSLVAVFTHFYEKTDPESNLLFLASAEEEISGSQGVASVLDEIGPINFGIVGEPTQMQMAVAEKGLLVIDGEAKGKAGHAARDEGINAIYIVMQDVGILKNFHFKKTSDLLGPVKVSVTQISAGTQHNVVPDTCHFVVDVRTNEHYSNEAVFDILQKNTASELTARSFRLNSSGIPLNHPLVKAGQRLGLSYFGSPTLSDQALMPFPTLKIGPGDSARSHTADEFVFVEEIMQGMEIYGKLLTEVGL